MLRIVLFLLLSIWTEGTLNAQDGNKNGSEVRLVDWLQELEQRYDVSFSYNNKLLNNLFVRKSNDCSSLQECLKFIKNNAPLEFDAVESNNFLIIPVRSDAQFKVVEEENGEPIISLRVKVNDQPEIYLLPEENSYTIPNLFPTDSIYISSRFFMSKKVLASELLNIKGTIKLASETTYLSEVVVKDYLTTGVDSKLSDHSLQINMSSLGLLAGESDGDILTTLKNIPGVRTPDGKPGSLNFRGSTFDH